MKLFYKVIPLFTLLLILLTGCVYENNKTKKPDTVTLKFNAYEADVSGNLTPLLTKFDYAVVAVRTDKVEEDDPNTDYKEGDNVIGLESDDVLSGKTVVITGVSTKAKYLRVAVPRKAMVATYIELSSYNLAANNGNVIDLGNVVLKHRKDYALNVAITREDFLLAGYSEDRANAIKDIYVTGPFNSWTTNDVKYKLVEDKTTGIYTFEFTGLGATEKFEYKFCNDGSWANGGGMPEIFADNFGKDGIFWADNIARHYNDDGIWAGDGKGGSNGYATILGKPEPNLIPSVGVFAPSEVSNTVAFETNVVITLPYAQLSEEQKRNMTVKVVFKDEQGKVITVTDVTDSKEVTSLKYKYTGSSNRWGYGVAGLDSKGAYCFTAHTIKLPAMAAAVLSKTVIANLTITDPKGESFEKAVTFVQAKKYASQFDLSGKEVVVKAADGKFYFNPLTTENNSEYYILSQKKGLFNAKYSSGDIDGYSWLLKQDGKTIKTVDTSASQYEFDFNVKKIDGTLDDKYGADKIIGLTLALKKDGSIKEFSSEKNVYIINEAKVTMVATEGAIKEIGKVRTKNPMVFKSSIAGDKYIWEITNSSGEMTRTETTTTAQTFTFTPNDLLDVNATTNYYAKVIVVKDGKVCGASSKSTVLTVVDKTQGYIYAEAKLPAPTALTMVSTFFSSFTATNTEGDMKQEDSTKNIWTTTVTIGQKDLEVDGTNDVDGFVVPKGHIAFKFAAEHAWATQYGYFGGGSNPGMDGGLEVLDANENVANPNWAQQRANWDWNTNKVMEIKTGFDGNVAAVTMGGNATSFYMPMIPGKYKFTLDLETPKLVVELVQSLSYVAAIDIKNSLGKSAYIVEASTKNAITFDGTSSVTTGSGFEYRWTVKKDGVTITTQPAVGVTTAWMPTEKGSYSVRLDIFADGEVKSTIEKQFMVSDTQGIIIVASGSAITKVSESYDDRNNYKGVLGRAIDLTYTSDTFNKPVTWTISSPDGMTYRASASSVKNYVLNEVGTYNIYVEATTGSGVYLVTERSEVMTVTVPLSFDISPDPDNGGTVSISKGESFAINVPVITPSYYDSYTIVILRSADNTYVKYAEIKTMYNNTIIWTPTLKGAFKVYLNVEKDGVTYTTSTLDSSGNVDTALLKTLSVNN